MGYLIYPNVKKQILDSLKDLTSIGLEHSVLTYKNILISTKGLIRIGKLLPYLINIY